MRSAHPFAVVAAFAALACEDAPSCEAPRQVVAGVCVDAPRSPGPGGGAVLEGPCEPGARFCAEGSAALCDADGARARLTVCPLSSPCIDGRCTAPCTPGAATVCSSSIARAICNADGLTTTSSACPSATPLCVGGACVEPPPRCTPGARRCGGDDLLTCDADGMRELRTPCELGCADARCVAPCGDTDDDQVGCEFAVLKLANHDLMLPFAITVSNVTAQDARVVIRRGWGPTVLTRSVRAGSLERIELPQAVGLAATGLSGESLFVESDTPITVHQFNPINNVGAYSNDASLLLPTNVGGTEHWAVGFGTTLSMGASYVTIVATEAGTTQLEVTPRAEVHGSDGVPDIAAGQTARFTLTRGRIVSIGSGDITGTHIVSDKKVTVFTGHTCANIPLGVPWCDHLEEQLLPVRLWGNHAIVAKLARRGSEPDLIRVLAAVDGTVLATTPPVAGLDGVRLAAGEHAEALSSDDFVLSASTPVLVSQFMVGAEFGCDTGACAIARHPECVAGMTAVGDPSHLQIVPTARFASNYLVLVPDDYRVNHLSVVAPAPASVTVDGAPLRLAPIGATGFATATREVGAGLRRVRADAPFGLYVYGYDCDVSYGYPGGLR